MTSTRTAWWTGVARRTGRRVRTRGSSSSTSTSSDCGLSPGVQHRQGPRPQCGMKQHEAPDQSRGLVTLLVGAIGFEPMTPSASRKCSPPELSARCLLRGGSEGYCTSPASMRNPPFGAPGLGLRAPNAAVRLPFARGRGSVGRAQPCQGWGRGFESRRPLHDPSEGWSNGFARQPDRSAFFLDRRPRRLRSATSPSGKAGACKALIPSSNLGVASSYLPAETLLLRGRFPLGSGLVARGALNVEIRRSQQAWRKEAPGICTQMNEVSMSSTRGVVTRQRPARLSGEGRAQRWGAPFTKCRRQANAGRRDGDGILLQSPRPQFGSGLRLQRLTSGNAAIARSQTDGVRHGWRDCWRDVRPKRRKTERHRAGRRRTHTAP